jgi:hypothetical protein
MSFYTVQVQPPVLNWSDPLAPISWHLAIRASSPTEALAIVDRGHWRGMPAKVVPPLGFTCRADLSWDPPYTEF